MFILNLHLTIDMVGFKPTIDILWFVFFVLYFSKFFFVPLSILLLGDYFFSYFILMYWWLSGFISMCNYSLVVFKFFPYLWFLALITMCLLNLTVWISELLKSENLWHSSNFWPFSPRCLFWYALSSILRLQ